MQRYIYVLLIISAALLTGCTAKPADPTAMTVSKDQIHAKIATDSKFYQKLTVNSVSGGKETHPLLASTVNNSNLKSALCTSLQHRGYITDPQEALYQLNAEILEMHQPMIGLSFTVTTVINYTILDVKNNKLIFDDKINSTYTAKFNEAFLGVTRMRLAMEGSVRNNIQTFIEKLEPVTG